MLEDRLEQMFKMCNSVINNGKIFVQEFQYERNILFFFINNFCFVFL
jgi:hypothetical protein